MRGNDSVSIQASNLPAGTALSQLLHVPMEYRQYRHEDGSWKGW